MTDIELPNGVIMQGVPDGATKEQIMAKAIASGVATESDFGVQSGDAGSEPSQSESPPTSGRRGRAKKLATDRKAKRESFLSSLEPEQRGMLEDISGPEAFLVGLGRGFSTVGKGIGLIDDSTESENQAFRNLEEISGAATAGDILGEAAPFVPLALASGGVVPATASAAARVAPAVAVGALEGGILTSGKGEEDAEVLKGTIAGGAIAGAIDLALPVIGRIGRKIVSKVTGKTPSNVVTPSGAPTSELIDAMDELGITYDDVLEEAGIPKGTIDPKALSRKAFLESQGLAPTQAQITRDASDFQAQQEVSKTSGRVRDALEEQEMILSSRFDSMVKGSKGDIATETNPIIDAVTDKATVLDKEITELYGVARDAAKGEKNIRASGLANKLKDLAPSNRRAGGNIEAVVGDLQSKGVLDKDMKVVGRVDVETAEDTRKLMNELYDPQNPFGNMKLKELKDALDEDVFKAAGEDVFKSARKAKSEFEKGLSRAKINKFDSRNKNIVRDILENKIDPDQLTDKVVFGKAWRKEDLQEVKSYITDSEAGEQAFNDLRADVLQDIKEKSFIGPEDGDGFKALSRDKLEKTLKTIGKGKLDVLFSPDEVKQLQSLLQIAKLREPVRGTALGRGPSAQAVDKIVSTFDKGGIINDIIRIVTLDKDGKAVLKANAAIKDITPISPARTAAAVGGASLAAPEQDQGI
jgi:hypothetical protein